jgi:hypothetical protein
MNNSHKFLCLGAIAGVLLWPCRATATTVYTVTVNTSSLVGQAGFLDLQLEPGPNVSQLATAVVTGFTETGTLTGGATLTGDVMGQLPSTLTFDNQTVFNDYFQGLDFGTEATFTVALDGPTNSVGGPSAFNISLYAADGSTPLLTVSPDGNAAQITIDPDGTQMAVTYASGVGSPSVVTIVSAGPTAPEPSTLGFMGLSLGTLAVFWRKRSLLQ